MRNAELQKMMKRRRLDRILVRNEANVRALTGIVCDNAVLSVEGDKWVFYTDFRYAPMVRRVAPGLACRDLARLGGKGRGAVEWKRIGYEGTVSHAQFLAWEKMFPKATFVDVAKNLSELRAVKTDEEISGIRAAEALACEIWTDARTEFRAGITERQMARIIQKMMIDRGDGEAFSTIVCVGRNAAECHHEPDDTPWNGRDGVLVDMGVRLRGFCSDLTRNILPQRPSTAYRRAYDLVYRANRAAIAAVRPGMSGRALDKVARDIIRKGGFGSCFGHSLGHGVGYEIHEAPTASKKSDCVLRPGMLVTIEPGIYIEGNLGVRIEDLVLVTETGCEVLSASCTVDEL